MGKTDIGGGTRLEARSANGLSSSINGDPLKGEPLPNPELAAPKSPRGGELIFSQGIRRLYYEMEELERTSRYDRPTVVVEALMGEMENDSTVVLGWLVRSKPS